MDERPEPPFYQSEFCIEDDDFVAAVGYAVSQQLDALSMSFTGNQGSSVHTALASAFYDHDIVLLASLGNRSGDSDDLVKRDYVAGVGGVFLNGERARDVNLQHRDFSGSWSAYTTMGDCPVRNDWCRIGDPGLQYRTVHGTSPAAAAVAGIVGLVRSYAPELTAP